MAHRFRRIVKPLSTRATARLPQALLRSLPAGLLILALAACGTPMEASVEPSSTTSGTTNSRLRLATTTSTADSGLLDAILPDFEQRYQARVEVIAVGTGQALKLGENGDADVVLVHARQREDEFMQQGFGSQRRDVMYNDFVIVGPGDDSAQISGSQTAGEAFAQIAAASASFASRGDDSGTFTKEQAIWSSANISPAAELGWYKSLGQGMGETLITANELGAYALADRGTFLSMRDRLPNLTLLVGGATVASNPDSTLLNPYGVIQVNPARHAGINDTLAAAFVEWITAPETQKQIGEFGVDRFGQPLFYPQAQKP